MVFFVAQSKTSTFNLNSLISSLRSAQILGTQTPRKNIIHHPNHQTSILEKIPSDFNPKKTINKKTHQLFAIISMFRPISQREFWGHYSLPTAQINKRFVCLEVWSFDDVFLKSPFAKLDLHILNDCKQFVKVNTWSILLTYGSSWNMMVSQNDALPF